MMEKGQYANYVSPFKVGSHWLDAKTINSNGD